MSSDVESELYLALKSGKVLLGARKVIKRLKLGENPKLVVIASNTPEHLRKELEYLSKLAGVPLYRYQGRSLELGRAFKKPFFVSAAAIVEEGESRILELVGSKEVR
ncbi:MAG: 50S ribosomal protein L30e [Candidatus Korarchaeum sp.]|nr:50S ribosomal protein L30e [Candidatus Korarchaeum sp.]MDW8034853.1 50S ribosomal protein L30e [Candidatus Korarchaeum sp.]